MNIGFIGLGIMGKPMAKNLLKAGHTLTVYDINTAAVDELCRTGAAAAGSIAELAGANPVIMTMLPNSPQVRDVVLSENGVIRTAKPGTVLIDMSSINPDVSREVAKALSQQGIDMLDAPVSGGEPKAIDGTLAFMVGGAEAVFAKYSALLRPMGASITRCGDIGAGNVTKLCNQIIVAVNIAAVSEALMLGMKSGVSPEQIFQAIRGGLAGSTVLDAKAPMMMERNFKPGFKLDLHIKDLTNVLDAAKACDSPTPMTAMVFDMMKVLHGKGCGQHDHSGLAEYYELLADTQYHA